MAAILLHVHMISSLCTCGSKSSGVSSPYKSTTAGWKPQGIPRWNLKLVSTHGEQEAKEKGRVTQVGMCRFTKQGNLLMRLVLGGQIINRSSHLPTRILKGYVEAFTGYCHLPSRWSQLHFTLSSLCLSIVEIVNRAYIPRTGRRMEFLIAWIQLRS